MEFSVRGKNVELTPALRRYVEKKVGRIEKYFEIPLHAQVTLSVERNRHIVEVTVALDGIMLRGEEVQNDMYASIDLVVEKLEKQIEKYKTRLYRRLRQNSETRTGERELESAEAQESEEEGARIVRVKRFSMKPMAVEEAIMQMNLIGHDFFVFVNSETEQVGVIYRRKDGNYGLIEPELGR